MSRGGRADGHDAMENTAHSSLRSFHDELLRIEFWIRLVEWLNEHHSAIYKGLHAVDAPLADEFMLRWESGGAPYGLMRLNLREMCLCRAVDSFQRILVAFIGEVFEKKPETLLGLNEPVSAAEVLRSTSIDEFREQFAARQLRRLERFSDVRKLLGLLGVEMKVDEENERRVTNAIALRNLIVHQGSAVHEEFLKATGRTDVTVGTVIGVDHHMLREALRALRDSADAFQIALGEKYFGHGVSQTRGGLPILDGPK